MNIPDIHWIRIVEADSAIWRSDRRRWLQGQQRVWPLSGMMAWQIGQVWVIPTKQGKEIRSLAITGDGGDTQPFNRDSDARDASAKRWRRVALRLAAVALAAGRAGRSSAARCRSRP